MRQKENGEEAGEGKHFRLKIKDITAIPVMSFIRANFLILSNLQILYYCIHCNIASKLPKGSLRVAEEFQALWFRFCPTLLSKFVEFHHNRDLVCLVFR